jgi:Tol biopolymer transport system component
MRTKNLVIGVVFLFAVMVFFAMSTRSQKPVEQPKFEVIEIGTGGSPKWSPDGTKLAFMSGGWLCAANGDGKGEIEKIVQLKPWTFDWMSDSAFVVSDKIPWNPPGKGRGHKFIIETVNMKGQAQIIREDSLAPGNEAERQYVSYIGAPVILKDGTVGYYEIDEKPEGGTKIFKTMRQGKLKPDSTLKQMIATTEGYPVAGEIWLESVDRTVRKKITPGKKYLFPVLSPDNTKILAKVSSYTSGLVILNLNGEVVTDLDVGARETSPGLIAAGSIAGASWSPDSKKIIYNWVVEDGHSIHDKDIYMVNVDGTGKVPIAATPNDIEKDASWSPDGTKIAYRSETSGKIFVVKLK